LEQAFKDIGGRLLNETAIRGAGCDFHEKKLEVLAVGIDLYYFD
jgi:hypothetical protein